MDFKKMADMIRELTSNLNLEISKQVLGNKAAGKRARKLSLELGILLKDFRKASIENSKQKKS